jgi:hypothetical protein
MINYEPISMEKIGGTNINIITIGGAKIGMDV